MILITGASGNVGSAVLAEVARSGSVYRAMYRSAEDAAKRAPGSEAVIADFADKASLARALRGIESVYLVCSPILELVEFEGNVIEASEAAGVRRIVLSSALGAGDYPKSFPSWHRKVEDKLRATAMRYCILRPNSFIQNVLTFYAPGVRSEGAFYASMGTARTCYVDIRDVAAVAASALTGEAHDGKTYELHGPEGLTCDEVAQKIARHAGVPARYVDISVEAQRTSMLAAGLPPWQVTALLELQEYYTNGRGGTPDAELERLLGRPPRTMAQFIQERAGSFRGRQSGS